MNRRSLISCLNAMSEKAMAISSQAVRVCGINKGIPPHRWMTLAVRQRQRVFIRFHEKLSSVAAHDREKWILIRLLESSLKTKPLAVEGDGLIHVAHDEKW